MNSWFQLRYRSSDNSIRLISKSILARIFCQKIKGKLHSLKIYFTCLHVVWGSVSFCMSAGARGGQRCQISLELTIPIGAAIDECWEWGPLQEQCTLSHLSGLPFLLR